MRKFFLVMVLLICSLAVFTGNAKAAEKKSGKYSYEVLDKKKKTVAITHVGNVGATVKIPKKIKGYTVVQIGRMKRVKTTDSADNTNISNCIFSEEDTQKVEKIKLPDTLRKIGVKALKNCKNLKKIDFPKGLRYIGACAMEKCYKIKKVTMPNGLKSIGSYAFYRCKAIEKVILKTNKAKIGIYAFATGGSGTLSEDGSCLKEINMPVTYKGRILRGAFGGYIGETFTWGNLTAANGAFFLGVHTLKKIKVHKNAKEVDIPRNCLMDSAKQLEIVVPKYVKKVYIGQQRYNIKQVTILGLDTTIEGDYAMGFGNPHIMISVEAVKCQKKSVAWDMASQYIYPDLTNIDWENFEMDSMYRETNVNTKQVKLIKL